MPVISTGHISRLDGAMVAPRIVSLSNVFYNNGKRCLLSSSLLTNFVLANSYVSSCPTRQLCIKKKVFCIASYSIIKYMVTVQKSLGLPARRSVWATCEATNFRRVTWSQIWGDWVPGGTWWPSLLFALLLHKSICVILTCGALCQINWEQLFLVIRSQSRNDLISASTR